MDYRKLGLTGIKVSRLCFGSLSIGPLQANLPVSEGAAVIRSALERGVNFIDTAQLYYNYPPIRAAISGISDEIHIATKSYAVTGQEIEESLSQALQELDLQQISIFLLHEQESADTLRGHQGALDRLVRAKAEGFVRAIGISTHCVAGVRAAAGRREIDVIHPLINMTGIGIVDGTADDMLRAIDFARQMGKGIYGMKALAGGHLHQKASLALQWAFSLGQLDAVAVGMKSKAEVEANVALAEAVSRGAPLEELVQLLSGVTGRDRRLLVEAWCRGCGTCVTSCPSKALAVHGGKVFVDRNSCVLCGYCGGACPDFALKII